MNKHILFIYLHQQTNTHSFPSLPISSKRTQDLRLFPLHVGEVWLKVVVVGRLGLEVILNLGDLVVNSVHDASEGLLDGELGHLPLEPSQVGGQVHCEGGVDVLEGVVCLGLAYSCWFEKK